MWRWRHLPTDSLLIEASENRTYCYCVFTRQQNDRRTPGEKLPSQVACSRTAADPDFLQVSQGMREAHLRHPLLYSARFTLLLFAFFPKLASCLVIFTTCLHSFIPTQIFYVCFSLLAAYNYNVAICTIVAWCRFVLCVFLLSYTSVHTGLYRCNFSRYDRICADSGVTT